MEVDNVNAISLDDTMFYTTRAPIQIVLVTSDTHFTIDAISKMPFDMNIIMTNGSNEKVANYIALDDKRWMDFKVAFMPWYPELFQNKDGTLTGTAHDIWTFLREKLHFTIEPIAKVRTVPSAYDLLKNRTINLVIPHDVYSSVMLKVKA